VSGIQTNARGEDKGFHSFFRIRGRSTITLVLASRTRVPLKSKAKSHKVIIIIIELGPTIAPPISFTMGWEWEVGRKSTRLSLNSLGIFLSKTENSIKHNKFKVNNNVSRLQFRSYSPRFLSLICPGKKNGG
jgi:hypothetical protein